MPSRDQWTKHFSDFVAETRAESGLSVSAMAERWGVDERTYRKYERGISSPTVIDFCAILDNLDQPILRPLLNFIHPDVYGSQTDDIDHMRDGLKYYIDHVAPDRIVRQVYYNLVGQVADNVAPQLEMVSAVQHLPLMMRVIIVNYILQIYDLCEARGELVNLDQLPPDLDALRLAAQQAAEAVKQMRSGYSTITTDTEKCQP